MVTTLTTGPTTESTTGPTIGKAAARAAIDEIAAQFGETEDEPKRLIKRALRTLGEERVRAFVAQALEVEAAGGLLLPDGSRRRTPGGVLFHLMRTGIDKKTSRKIFWSHTTPQGQGAQGSAQGVDTDAMATEATPFDWAAFAAAAAEAMNGAGEASTVKLTLIGKPGTVVERGDVALVALRSEKAPSLPKGVPAPESPQTDYMALVGMKQWRKVAEALAANPDDKVIIEGYPTVRPDFVGITVHATSATTTGIQAAKRTAAPAATV
jgi:hypothetical protein